MPLGGLVPEERHGHALLAAAGLGILPGRMDESRAHLDALEVAGFDAGFPRHVEAERLERAFHAVDALLAPRERVPGRRVPRVVALVDDEAQAPTLAAVARNPRPDLGDAAQVEALGDRDEIVGFGDRAEVDLHGESDAVGRKR